MKKGVFILSDPFLTELKQLLQQILTDEKTKKELDEINNLKQIYNIFKANGFSGDYESFKKSISKIFKISEEKMEEIAGGITTSPPLKTLLATAITSMTLCGPMIATPNALVTENDLSSSNLSSSFINSKSFSNVEEIKDNSNNINPLPKKDENTTLGKKIRLNLMHGKITSTKVSEINKVSDRLWYCLYNKLTETEIKNLENVLPNNNLINQNYEEWKREMCKGLKVDYKSLNSLVSEVINSKGNKNDEFTILFSLCNGDNIYDIQKRFVLSVILNELNKRNSDLYPTYFKMNEEVNKEIIVNALSEQSKSPAAKSMMHVMLMAQLGELEINRRSDMIPAKEYIASIFKYGESILIRHPLAINKQSSEELWKALYPGKGISAEWQKRVSSHGIEITPSGELKEAKYSGLQAVTNAPYAFITSNNQGIGINISRKNAALDTAGHLLVYNTENNLGEASLVKLESAGPGSTSVFGHGHGLNVNSNKISATCQIKALSEHTARDAVHIDMRGANSQKLTELVRSLDKWVDLNESNPEVIKEMLNKLAGPKMSLGELEKFTHKYTQNTSWSNEDFETSAKGKNTTTKEIIDVSASEEMKNLGIRIFNNSKGNYMYYVEDESKLKQAFGSNEAKKIKSSQFKWMQLKSDSSISVENIINQSLEAKIKEGKINPLNYETFLSKSLEEEWIKNKMENSKNEYEESLAIPGVQLYRSKKSSWGISYTVYGYIITNIQTFKDYAKQTLQMNDNEINFVIDNQNLWMWTSGSSGLNINNLPEKFLNALSLVKNMHTANLKDPKARNDKVVIEIHPSNLKNDKIIRNI